MRKIIHVGLAKTGTTHLQTKVFKELDRLGILHYRKDLGNHIRPNLFKQKVFNEPNQTFPDLDFDKFTDDSIHLISTESFLSFDPRGWNKSLKNLLTVFGEDSEILITLREPLSYLRSVYQQMIHEGESDLTPESFFLKLELYDKYIEYFGRSNETRRFSIDEMDYVYLFNSFTKIFKRVYFSDMETTMNYQFLVDMKIMDESSRQKLRSTNEFKILNKAYSKKAMNMDRTRYKILYAMNLTPKSTSINSRNTSEKLILNLSESMDELTSISHSISSKKDSLEHNKLKWFFKKFMVFRALVKILRLPNALFKNWRFFLQSYINIFIKYEKYELPSDMYLGKHFQDNVYFYSTLPKSKGYKKNN